jgi:hypothetical protein
MQDGNSRRPRPRAGASDWYATAVTLRREVEKLAHGNREQGLRELAEKHDIPTADTLRRSIAAAAFLDRLDNIAAKKGAALRRASVSAVELISRWFAYDEKAALQAAGDLARGSYTVVQLRTAERTARMASKAPRQGRSGAHLLRKRLAPKIKELIEATGQTYATAAPGRYDTTRIDFLFQSSIDPSIRIAVAIFGPFGTERLYNDRAEDFLIKIFGLSRMYSEVVAILPLPKKGLGRMDYLLDWMTHYNVHNITFYYLNPDTLEIHSP